MPNCMEFTLFGEKLSFHIDLVRFLQWKSYLENQAETLTNDFLEYHAKNMEPKLILEKMQGAFDLLATELIEELLKHEMYHCTKNNYLDNNKGYIFLKTVTESYYSFSKETTDENNQEKMSQLSKARRSAYGEVTGLGFGIMTSSVSSHIAYNLLSKREINKQSQKAELKYMAEGRSIENAYNQKLALTIKDFYNNTYREEFINGIYLTFSFIIQIFTQDLLECGQLESDYKKGIDEKVCADYLSNFTLSQNKKKILALAIKACPYSLEAYRMALEENLFCEELVEIAIYFKLGEKIFWLTVPNDYDNYADIQSFINKNRNTIYWLAQLMQETESDIYTKILHGKFNRIDALFRDIKKVIKQEETFGILVKYYTAYNSKNNFSDWLVAIISNIVTCDDFSTLQKICGESTVHSVTTRTLGIDDNLSYNQICDYCIEKVSNLYESTQSNIENELIELTDRIQCRNKDIEKLKGKNNVITKLFGFSLCVGVFSLILVFIAGSLWGLGISISILAVLIFAILSHNIDNGIKGKENEVQKYEKAIKELKQKYGRI